MADAYQRVSAMDSTAKPFMASNMPDQEYLDRQDNYSANFFIDKNGNWYKNVIYINSWRIINKESEIKYISG